VRRASPNPSSEGRWGRNQTTRALVTGIGILLALTGSVHGIREVLLGTIAPASILPAEVGALILLPTYMASGVATVVVSVLLAAWTLAFVQTRYGPSIFLAICAVLTLTGGGIAQILLFLIGWAVSTRINRPLRWWGRVLPTRFRLTAGRLWLVSFVAFMTAVSAGVAIWLTGFVPGTTNKDVINGITWSLLTVGMILLGLSVVSAFCKDVENANSQAALRHGGR